MVSEGWKATWMGRLVTRMGSWVTRMGRMVARVVVVVMLLGCRVMEAVGMGCHG